MKNNTECYEQLVKLTTSAKEVRKIGYELGYGCTMGVCCALFIIGFGVSSLRALARYSAKKSQATEEKEETAE